MKKILIFIAISIFTSAYGQVQRKNAVLGSWINSTVSNFYRSIQSNGCDTSYFERNEVVPLYMAFENKNQVKIAYRVEQRIVTYKVKYSGSDIIMSYRGKKVYKIAIVNNLLRLYYKGNLIEFNKVSDHYSKDVFGDLIKNIILKNSKFYFLDLPNPQKNKHVLVDKNNFKDQVKKVFGCTYVDFVQLGLFQYKNVCLPEIALYYEGDPKHNSPQVLGVLQDRDNIKLVNKIGNVLLELKSN
jgi:hypothetical protein